MAGSDDAVFVEGDGKYPVSATVQVYRMYGNGHIGTFAATARWNEYCPDNAPMWRKMPYTMLAKCAEALALRKAFPQELAGLYAKEELDQADAPVQRAAPKIGPNVLHNPAPDPPDAASATQPEPVPAPPSAGGLPYPMPPVATEGFEVAKKGLAQLEQWWVALSKSEQKQLAPYKDQLKEVAKDADVGEPMKGKSNAVRS
jgi:hypothetical protein